MPYPDPGLVLFENPRVKPRAFVTYRATPAPSSEALLESLAAPDFDPLAASFVDDHAGLGSADAPRGHAVSVVRDAASEVELEVEAAALGLVVLADAHAGGWRARVDGEPARILVANHLYRGVVIPPGRHRVSFHYAVPGLGVGLVLSILGIAALVGLGPLLHRTLLRSGYHAGDPVPGEGA